MNIIPLDSRQWFSSYIKLDENYWREKLTLHSNISVTDKVNINEQSKSIATRVVYKYTDFKIIWTLLPKDMAVLNPMGYRTS